MGETVIDMEKIRDGMDEIPTDKEEINLIQSVDIIVKDSVADRKRILEKNTDVLLPCPLELSDLEIFLDCGEHSEDLLAESDQVYLSIESEPVSPVTASPEPTTPRKGEEPLERASPPFQTDGPSQPDGEEADDGEQSAVPGTCRSVTPPPPRIPTPLQEALLEIRRRRTTRTPPLASVTLELKETPTIILLEMDYKTLSGEAAHIAWRADMQYYHKTYGAGRHRHRIDEVTQTRSVLHRHAASNTIMTTLADIGMPESEKPFCTSKPSVDRIRATAHILERIIASNYAQKKQMQIMARAPVAVGPWPSLKRLFRWSAPSGDDVAVTAVAWNSAEPTIMAVAHGTLHWALSSRTPGLVRIWSVKNPIHPEQEYRTSAPVSVISFAPHRPAVLTIACRDGKIFMVSLASSTRTLYEIRPGHSGPVTSLVWLNLPFDGIELASAAADGHVFVRPLKPTITPGCPSFAPKTIKLPRYPGANSCISAMAPHQTNPDKLLIGTLSGNLLLLLVSRRDACGGYVKAHSGAVSALERSPFTPDVFYSAGADGDVALWLDSPDSVAADARLLRRFKCGAYQPVESVKWSPTHPTLFVALVDTLVQVWDVRVLRETPVTVYDTKIRNSALAFNMKGDRLIVGDSVGRVRLLEVSAPRAARLPRDALLNALGIPLPVP